MLMGMGRRVVGSIIVLCARRELLDFDLFAGG